MDKLLNKPKKSKPTVSMETVVVAGVVLILDVIAKQNTLKLLEKYNS